MFVFNPKLSSPFIHVNVTVTSALSPGCNNVFSNACVVIVPSASSVHSGLSAASNLNPSGMSSLISIAYPAMSPSFVILIVYTNFTTVVSNLFLFISTFGIISSSPPVFPVSVTVVTPSSVTIT